MSAGSPQKKIDTRLQYRIDASLQVLIFFKISLIKIHSKSHFKKQHIAVTL